MPHSEVALHFLDVFTEYAGWRLGKNSYPGDERLIQAFNAFLEGLGGQPLDPRFTEFVAGMMKMAEGGDVDPGKSN